MARYEGLDIQSVAFAADQIEVVYAEERDVTNKSGVLEYRTIVIPAMLVENSMMEALDSVKQLIDEAQIAKRNPAANIR